MPFLFLVSSLGQASDALQSVDIQKFFTNYRWEEAANRKNEIWVEQLRVRLCPAARVEYDHLKTNWGRNYPTTAHEVKVRGIPAQVLRAQISDQESRIVAFNSDCVKIFSGTQRPAKSVQRKQF